MHSTAHLANSDVTASHIQSCVDTHLDSGELQSGHVPIVEREEDDFECPECWKHFDTQQSIVHRLTAFARHIFSFDEQRQLPQGLAKSRTGEVSKEENSKAIDANIEDEKWKPGSFTDNLIIRNEPVQQIPGRQRDCGNSCERIMVDDNSKVFA